MPFRNIETYFSKAPQVKYGRTRFKYNMPVKTTFNAGDLVPFLVEPVLPGDTFDLKLSKVVRLTTSLHPTMDNLYLDTYFFFVPNRLIWDHWEEFNGANSQQWAQTGTFVPPTLRIGGTTAIDGTTYRVGKVEPQSLLNYLGVPSFTEDSKKVIDINIMRMNRYFKLWNDFFRSENLIDEIPIPKADGLLPTAFISAYSNFMTNNFGASSSNNDFYDNGSCLKVAKYADYFTRALPDSQKGSEVLIPADGYAKLNVNNPGGAGNPGFRKLSDGSYLGAGNDYNIYGYGSAPGNIVSTTAGSPGTPSTTNIVYDPAGTLSLAGIEITINNLRLAIQTQRFLERQARSGSRYNEFLLAQFGVVSPDARLQRAEYLGGKRTLINMSEVIQTSESTSTSPLGQLAGRSITSGIEDSFIKSFVEHGYIIGVMCVRPDRTYSQGLDRDFNRFDTLSYYLPVLDHIGEQPILNQEIYMPDKGSAYDPKDAFGFQEAWAEYRTQRARLTGFMQPGISGSLAAWNYGDNYTSQPLLSAQWLYQGKAEIDRTLAVPSTTAPQFMADMLVYGKMIRTMSAHSIPGLMDHC